MGLNCAVLLLTLTGEFFILREGLWVKIAMTVAGSDSGAGAGIQADLKTFAAMKVYGLSVVTAVTAQNTAAVTGIHPVPPEFVARQIDTLMEDFTVHSVKTGMLTSVEIIEVVCERFDRYRLPHIVADPVMIATSGDMLIEGETNRLLQAIRNTLLPAASVITPNIPEAEILTGREIAGLEDMKAAAVDLHKLGAVNVVIKGGHLDGEDAVDLLFDGNDMFEYRARRVLTRNTHGTGCTFSAALAAGLAKGLNLQTSVAAAKEFIKMALEGSLSIGCGRGPTNHFAELYQLAAKDSGVRFCRENDVAGGMDND